MIDEATKRYRLKWREENRDKVNAYQRKYYRQKPLQHKVHRHVQEAIQQGKLLRLNCEVCGSYKTDAHHDDYSKELDVKWLCRLHHRQRHNELGWA